MDLHHDLQAITQVTAGALVAEISHQLRQPLNALNLYVASAQELLTRSDADPVALKAMANAEAQVQRLARLMGDLSLQLAIPEPVCVPVALTPLIQQVASMAQLPEGRLEWLDADDALLVLADPLPLSCVLRYIIDSCDDKRPIRMSMRQTQSEPSLNEVTFDISNGCPILSSALDLAVSKRLMESQGGRLCLKGSDTHCFQLTLPAA